MDLKAALSIVSRFTDTKSTERGEHTVRLSAGKIRASTAISGCSIPVPSVNVEANVPLRDLRRIASVVESPVLSVKRSTLHITDPASTFKLKLFPEAKLLPYPDEPDASAWTPIDGNTMSTLSALTGVLEGSAESANSLGALRVTDKWAASATQAMLVVLTKSLGVSEPVTVAPEAVAGLSGTEAGGWICVDDNKLWVKDAATEQVRWAQALVTPWPDSIVDSMLPSVRGSDGRIEVQSSLSALKGLSDRAKLLMAGDEYGKLTADPVKGTLMISGSFTRGSFDGGVKATLSDEIEPIGISPTRLATILDVLGSSADAFGAGDTTDLSFGGSGGPPQAILVRLGVLESLLMPVVLP